jgi:hypothetical protein
MQYHRDTSLLLLILHTPNENFQSY